MDINNPNFVSFMQTNYDTVQVSFLSAAPHGYRAAPAAQPMPAYPQPPGMPAPAWAGNDKPWMTQEDLKPAQPTVALYSYKVPKGLGLKVGDYVVVPSKDSITFARVEIVDALPTLDFTDSGIVYKWVIQKIDFDVYNQLMKAEAEFSQRMVEVHRMKHQQEMIKTMRNQFLSESDPETARLFSAALESIGAQVPAAPIDTESK